MKKILSILIMLVALVPFGVFGQNYPPGISLDATNNNIVPSRVCDIDDPVSFKVRLNHSDFYDPFIDALNVLKFDVVVNNLAGSNYSVNAGFASGSPVDCITVTQTGNVLHYVIEINDNCTYGNQTRQGGGVTVVQIQFPSLSCLNSTLLSTGCYGYTLNVTNVQANYNKFNGTGISDWFDIQGNGYDFFTEIGTAGICGSSSRLSSNESNEDVFEISVAPNPTNGNVMIDSNKDFNQIYILDITGRIVKNIHLVDFSRSKFLNLNNLESGNYIMKIIGQDGINSVEKLIISK